MTLQDLRPAIEARPAGELAMRVAPTTPATPRRSCPPAWLEPLRADAASAA